MSSHFDNSEQQFDILSPADDQLTEGEHPARPIGFVALGVSGDAIVTVESAVPEEPSDSQQSLQTTLPEHDTVVDKYTEKYLRKKDNLERRKKTALVRLEDSKARVARAESGFRERSGREPKPGQFQSMIVSAERAVVRMSDMLAFLRPSSAEDVTYRLRVLDNLGPEIRTAIPDGLPLRFHGTEIYSSRDVISSGMLSSSVDRLGYATSYDVADQVSVTTAETIETTLGSYTGLTSEDCCLPPGCIFVVLPSSEEEAEAGRSMLMGNVDFAKQPERLFAVITATENVDLVKRWASEAGIDSDKVDEFFAFADKLAVLKQAIDRGEINLQDLVPFQIA